jgi:hypothetical protein
MEAFVAAREQQILLEHTCLQRRRAITLDSAEHCLMEYETGFTCPVPLGTTY